MWNKINNIIGKIDKEPVYGGQHLNTKLKSCNGKSKTNFPGKETPKKDTLCIYFFFGSNSTHLCV